MVIPLFSFLIKSKMVSLKSYLSEGSGTFKFICGTGKYEKIAGDGNIFRAGIKSVKNDFGQSYFRVTGTYH